MTEHENFETLATTPKPMVARSLCATALAQLRVCEDQSREVKLAEAKIEEAIYWLDATEKK